MISNATLAFVYISVLSALAAGGAAYRSIVSLRLMRDRLASIEVDRAVARRELELAATVVAEAQLRLDRAEQDRNALADRVAALELRGQHRSYDQAIDSARSGADPVKLARQFGLSSSEAALLRLVHGARAEQRPVKVSARDNG